MRVVLDLSSSVLRVVGFRGRTPVRWAELPAAAEGGPPEPQAIQDLLTAARLRPRKVDIVLPATIGMVRVISLPPVPRRHIRTLLRQEVQSVLGLAPDDLDAAWVTVRRPQGDGLDIVLFLFHRAAMARYLEPLRAARVRAVGLYTLPATLRPALPGPEGAVAHLAEDGSLTLVAFSGGLPRQVQNSFISPGGPAAHEVARGLRTVRNQAGLPQDSLLAVTGPGAHPELRQELQSMGLPCAEPARLPGAPAGWPLDAYMACAGSLPLKGFPAIPRQPRPFDDRAERANRRAGAFVLAAVLLASAGELGRMSLWLQVRQLEEELMVQSEAMRAYIGAENLVDRVLAQRERATGLRRDLASVPPEPVDWLNLAPPLLQRATLTGVDLDRANSMATGKEQQAAELEVTGSAPTMGALDIFIAQLAAPPFRGAYLVRMQVDEAGGISFTARVMLEGGGKP